MLFLDTEPAAIDRFDFAGRWGRFAVAEERLRLATLRELWRGDVPLSLGAPGGRSLRAALWSIDGSDSGRLHFLLAPGGQHIARAAEMLAEPDLWVAGYLQNVKVQFDLRDVIFESVGGRSVVHSQSPRIMVHLPRRRTVRVRCPLALSPRLRFDDPNASGGASSWQVLDISLAGCAVGQPAGTARLFPGATLIAAEIELEPGESFTTSLAVQHLHRRTAATLAAYTRLGCAWRDMPESAQETLQRWIRRGHRSRDTLSLKLD